MSTHWKKYDVFKRQKDSTFANSRAAVEELASRYIQVVAEPDTPREDMKEEARKLLSIEMTEVALWGNATDLSLLSHLSLEDLQNLQGREAISKSQSNIVDNDTDDVWSYLTRKSAQTDRRVDMALDNAGFEFFTDLLYAAYLLDCGLASCVKFHTKDFPWFVSIGHDRGIDQRGELTSHPWNEASPSLMILCRASRILDTRKRRYTEVSRHLE